MTRILAIALAFATTMLSPARALEPIEGQHFAPIFNLLEINRGNERLVTIDSHGIVTYGPHYTPDAAAEALWRAVASVGVGFLCRAERSDIGGLRIDHEVGAVIMFSGDEAPQ
jgi:hypothetical protein